MYANRASEQFPAASCSRSWLGYFTIYKTLKRWGSFSSHEFCISPVHIIYLLTIVDNKIFNTGRIFPAANKGGNSTHDCIPFCSTLASHFSFSHIRLILVWLKSKQKSCDHYSMKVFVLLHQSSQMIWLIWFDLMHLRAWPFSRCWCQEVVHLLYNIIDLEGNW